MMDIIVCYLSYRTNLSYTNIPKLLTSCFKMNVTRKRVSLESELDQRVARPSLFSRTKRIYVDFLKNKTLHAMIKRIIVEYEVINTVCTEMIQTFKERQKRFCFC